MGAGAGMVEERADAVRGFRGKNMLKSAGLFRDFLFIFDVQSFCEQDFCKAMAPYDVFRSLAALFCKYDHRLSVAGVIGTWTKSYMAAVQHLLVSVWLVGVLREFHQAYALHSL